MPTPEERHRALPDVILTAKALLSMIEQGKITSMDELRKKASLKAPVAAAVGAPAPKQAPAFKPLESALFPWEKK